MRSWIKWTFNLLLVLSALLGACVAISLYRPSQSPVLPPPAKPVTRWLWFDDSVRYERWHPSRTVSGPSFSWGASDPVSTFDLNDRVFASGRNVIDHVTSNPNGMMVVQTYDYWHVWQAAKYIGALTALMAIVRWKFRQRSPQRRGFCITCGYNLAGNTSGVCPECGRPTTAGVNA